MRRGQIKRITVVLSILTFCVAAMPVMGQAAETDEGTHTHVPFSLSFIPNVSVGGFMGGDIVTNCSINIIGGHVAKLNGIEFGSVLNWETEEVTGAQFSGVINFLESGNLTGVQVAGVANYVERNAMGGQIGTINYAKGDVHGLQIGALNHAGRVFLGAQTGVMNYTGGSLTGSQIGTVNYINDRLDTGAQIGVINIGGTIRGAQIGVVNIARKVEGTQIGVINYADEFSGAPIGLFSFVRKGQTHLDLWAGETSAFNVALKTGSKHVYSILALGYQPSFGDDPYRWSPGLGIGAHIPRGSRYVDIEALSSHVNEGEAWTEELHLLSGLRLIGGWQINPAYSVFAGVTLNVLVSEHNDGSHMDTVSIFERDGNRTHVRMWPGVIAGVRF